MNNQKFASKKPSLFRRSLVVLAVLALVYFGWQYLQNASPAVTTEEGLPETVESGLLINVEDQEVFTDSILVLEGVTAPGNEVFINGQAIPTSATGSFEASLQLAQGPNLINVEAIEPSGDSISLSRQVTYLLPGEPTPTPPPAESQQPVELLGLAIAVILLAVIIAVLRRQRPWVNLSLDEETLSPGEKGDGRNVSILVEIAKTTRISLYVQAPDGRNLMTLLNSRRRRAGRHTFTWDGYIGGEIVAPGIYFIACSAGILPARTIEKVKLRIEHNPIIHGP